MTSCLAARLVVIAAAPAILSCGHDDRKVEASAIPSVVELHWTDAAAKQAALLSKEGKLTYDLPQLRVYNGSGRLIYSLDTRKPWSPTAIGREIDQAIATGRPIAGPSLAKSLHDLRTTDGRAGASAVILHDATLVFDYWASWCAPCKVLEKSLLEWQSTKPAGAIQIVKAET